MNLDTVVFDLPFENGQKFKISQGYNGAFSHQNENALDFDMPIGTKILAAREDYKISKNFSALRKERFTVTRPAWLTGPA